MVATWYFISLGAKLRKNIRQAQRLLGVDAAANQQEIQAAWRNKLSDHHPDRGGDSANAQALNEARDVLLKNLK